MFTLAVGADKVPHRPHILAIEVRNVRTGFFEEAEGRAVVAHLPKDLQPVAEFTGWRKGEILALQWRQVDFKAGVVRLGPGSTKNDDGRVFAFTVYPALEALLRTQRERTTAHERATGQLIAWVFHREGRPIKFFSDAWAHACRAAGLTGRVFRDFHRTAVRNLERAWPAPSR
jgi:integrase